MVRCGEAAKRPVYTFADLASSGVGWNNFIEKSSLQPVLRSNNNNNRFTIRCVLTVIKPSSIEDAVSAIAVPESNLLPREHAQARGKRGCDLQWGRPVVPGSQVRHGGKIF